MTDVYILLDWAWRATVILAAAGLLNFFLRTSSASLRHLVWTCALAGVLALPLVSRGLPRWTVPVNARLLESPQAALISVQARMAAMASAGTRGTQSMAGRPAGPARSDRGRFATVASLWFAGAAAVMLYTALGWLVVLKLRRAAKPARPETAAAAAELAEAMGVRQSVRVLETERASIPVTWGVLRPMILVPSAVADDPAKLRVVLLHELAHILRRDYPVHLVGQLACALYWFHPLAWMAQRQALRLRERAADDLVLRHGVRASDYAGQLVGLARSLAAPRLCGSLAMAHKSYLEQRVRAILDGRARRVALSRAAVLAAAGCAAVLVVSVASVGAVAASQEAAAPAASYQRQVERDQVEIERTASVHGPQSLEYARSVRSLGITAYRSDHLAEAAAAFATAVPVMEARLGKGHADLMLPLYVMGLDAQVKKDDTLAAAYYQRAIDISVGSSAAGPAAILARVALAQLASRTGDDTRAATLLQQARAVSSENSYEMAVVLDTSAYILRKLGSDADAEKAEAGAKAMRAAIVTGKTPPSDEAVKGVVGGVLAKGFQDRPNSGKLEEVFRVGNGVLPPKLLSKVEPEYSQEARALKVQGTVVLQTIVGADGVAHDTKVIRGVGLGLDQKAVEAVRQWQFKPGVKDGLPVNVAATIEVNFRLM